MKKSLLQSSNNDTLETIQPFLTVHKSQRQPKNFTRNSSHSIPKNNFFSFKFVQRPNKVFSEKLKFHEESTSLCQTNTEQKNLLSAKSFKAIISSEFLS